MSAEPIPYDQIDCEIRPLVGLINQFPGIRTEFSCAGHKPDEDGYVTFRADNQRSLATLLAALPFMHCRATVVENQFHCRGVWIDVALHDGQALRYNLRFSGRPQYVQRQLIGELENSLTKALESRQRSRRRVTARSGAVA